MRRDARRGAREISCKASGASRREVANVCLASLRANGSRECAPDDRLREAIHLDARQAWIASSASLLAMTAMQKLPDGQITSCFPKWLVQPLLQKYFPSHLTQISSLIRTVPSQERGVAHVINVGRDAVDAGSARDEWC